MNYKQFKTTRLLTTSFIAALVAAAVVYKNIVLALAGVIIGVIFLLLVKRKTKAVLVDERIEIISGKAARFTYSIFTITIAMLALFFTIISRRIHDINYEMLGTFLSYITLFNLALYSISYKYFRKKYGDTDDE